ncbi:MAG: pyruvate dehydrogenase (acetyl-transferring) E1 component subunit alpha [Methanomassiliicoccales archaeon]|nr:pyruvate dehydrogenase (acetyl-transferring) E1 component subunit alpha [Methanomassiliicoccales archaeon]
MLMDDYDPLKGRMLSILDKDGKVVEKGLEPKIDDALLVQAYKTMVLTRLADEKAVRLQRQGRLGAYPPTKGQEASQIGPALALEKGDWMVWAFREMGALLLRGVPLWRLYLYWMGNEEGSVLEGDVNVTPSAVPVGSQVPHASGIAYAIKYRKEPKVALCYFGDGATSEGDFHEGLNLAGTMKLPAVFVCQNNQWAISVPRNMQTASPTLAQKACAYGFKGILVDGNDLLALYAAAKEAIGRARRGEGPTLIESFTYRMGDHTTSDDATRYRSEEEIAYWTARDPLARLRAYLGHKGLWDETNQKAWTEEAGRMVEEEVKKAEGHAPPTLDDVFVHTYATMPASLKEQLELHRSDLPARKEG